MTPETGKKRRLPPALHHRDFALLWVASLAMGLGSQMAGVIVGWQVYDIHQSAFDLGLIGLAEFVPLPLLALPAGHLADRFPRRLVFAGALLLNMAVMAVLVAVTLAGATRLWPFVALAAATGVASAIGSPAARALPPTLVPAELLPGAMALRSMAMQIATVAGPALGGFIFYVRPELPYAASGGLMVLALACVLGLRSQSARTHAESGGSPDWKSVLAGVGFVRQTPVLLGAISLDLFAVLFGGAIALAPLFARSILHVGTGGLGLLRAAPALGAIVAGVILARRPSMRRAGQTLFLVVAGFGVSMIVFGLSHSFPLSLAALAVSGFVDMISMNIRATTAALATPNKLRGRVGAVEMVFISASNQLGAFESGAAAALVGAVPAVVAGGALTIVLAAIWPRLFPALAHIDRLEELRPGRGRTLPAPLPAEPPGPPPETW
ncbi:MAG: MFS transporter [Gaiellaceae bacterium]